MNYKSDVLATVHVVDDDDSFRTGLMRLLSSVGFRSVGYSCAGNFLLAQSDEIVGCILLDIGMPGPSGIDLLLALTRRELPPPVIFVTGRDDIYTSVDAMKSGAFDYLVKPISVQRIVRVVRHALQVDAQRRMERREIDELRHRFDTLTRHERAIFIGITRNRLNKQLAADLGMCERTVKARRASMMRKLQASTLPDLVRLARVLEIGSDAGQCSDDEFARDRAGFARSSSLADSDAVLIASSANGRSPSTECQAKAGWQESS